MATNDLAVLGLATLGLVATSCQPAPPTDDAPAPAPTETTSATSVTTLGPEPDGDAPASTPIEPTDSSPVATLGPQGPECSHDRLSSAVRELEAAQPNATKNEIAAGAILDACPRSAFRKWQFEDLAMRSRRLEPADREILLISPQETKILWAMVCPEDRLDNLDPTMPAGARGVAAYDTCGWKALEIAKRSEMTEDVALGVVWAYYQVLRDHGVPHELARPLVRALIFADVPDGSNANSAIH